MLFVEPEAADLEVADISLETGPHVHLEGVLVESGSEIGDALNVDCAGVDGRIEIYPVHEVLPCAHVGIAHQEIRYVDVGPAVEDMEIVDLGLSVSDLCFSGHIPYGIAALLREGKMVGDSFHHPVGEL